MNEPLDEQYFKWLVHQVASLRLRSPSRTYWSLLRQLFTTQFVWFVPNDDNRVEDGRDLRHEFLEENELRSDLGWLALECSMLEMLIGLARRLAFEGEGESRDWFWEMIDNLDLRHYNDAYYDTGNRKHKRYIADVLRAINERTYNHDGSGGIFPLDDPQEDQREVELWYQMSLYLLERE